ncbi:MAG: glutaredoxin family protein [Burkholderiales bacterium]|jgi:hypothetical protein|nr:glutaredoxin family protein [Burkholderiales bacterium]
MIAVAGGLCASPAARAVDLWRWVDRAGVTHYSDRGPPTDARDVRQRRVQVGPATSDMPFDLALAVREHPVTLYTFDCGASCADARALLVLRGVPFTEKDAHDAAVQEEMRRASGSTGAPLLSVGRATVQGWEPGAWQTALDAAGYPKSPRTARAVAEAAAMRRQRGDVAAPIPPSMPVEDTPVMPPVMPDRADNLEPRTLQ